MNELLALFTRPWLLVAFPLGLTALVYIYRRRGKGKRIVVSSTLLLKFIKGQSQSRSKFKPPARFFLELLLIVLFSLAAADLFWNPTGPSVAIIVDNSLSSAARLHSGTRLDTMKEQVQGIVSSLALSATVKLFVSSPQLTEITISPPLTLGLAPALAQMQPAFSVSDLNLSLRALASFGHFDETFIVSASARSQSDSLGSIKLRSIQSLLAPIENNIAISALKYSPGKKNASAGSLSVQIRSFADIEAEFQLLARCLDSQRKWTDLEPLSVSLAPQALLSKSLKLRDGKQLGCRVELKFPGSAMMRDLLAEDNSAWVTTSNDQGGVLFVGDLSARETGLDKIPNYKFSYTNPADYLNRANNKAQLTLFHRYIPDIMPNGNWLALMPGIQALNYAARTEEIASATVWDKSHELLRYIQPNLLGTGMMQSFNPLPGFSEVISVKNGPVFLATQSESKRAIVSGIEMLPYSARENTSLSILLLNSLKWLSKYDPSGKNFLVPYTKLLGYDQIKYLDGLDAYQQSLAVSAIPGPGLVELSKAGEISVRAVNYFDENQSNLNSHTTVSLRNTSSNLVTAATRNMKNWLIMAIIAILLIDLIISISKSFRSPVSSRLSQSGKTL